MFLGTSVSVFSDISLLYQYHLALDCLPNPVPYCLLLLPPSLHSRHMNSLQFLE